MDYSGVSSAEVDLSLGYPLQMCQVNATAECFNLRQKRTVHLIEFSKKVSLYYIYAMNK